MSTPAATSAPALDLAVIDYGMGNLRSVLRAFERVGGKPRLVNNPTEAASADALVFPGQGAIVDCMRLLKETGLDRTVRDWIAADRPFFGVCLGLQALFEHSEEGDTPGLGIFPGKVVRFRLQAPYKIPHMGWNNVTWRTPTGEQTMQNAECRMQNENASDPMTQGLAASGAPSEVSPKKGVSSEASATEGDQFYFVHSYYAQPRDREIVWGETDYGGVFTSAIRRGNCFATQFHPEKSQAKGLQLYRNFLAHAARQV